MPTSENTGYRAEWWIGPIDQDWFYTEQEVREAQRRADKRAIVTDEPMTREAPRLRVIRKGERTCKAGHIYRVPLHGKTACPVCAERQSA